MQSSSSLFHYSDGLNQQDAKLFEILKEQKKDLDTFSNHLKLLNENVKDQKTLDHIKDLLKNNPLDAFDHTVIIVRLFKLKKENENELFFDLIDGLRCHKLRDDMRLALNTLSFEKACYLIKEIDDLDLLYPELYDVPKVRSLFIRYTTNIETPNRRCLLFSSINSWILKLEKHHCWENKPSDRDILIREIGKCIPVLLLAGTGVILP